MVGNDFSILIVDDHEPTRDGLITLLGAQHRCIAAASAEEAIRLLAARSFNLVLTDIHMPGASGLELCRVVQRLSPDTLVIVVSGMADIRYRIEALRLGILYYIEKPIDPEQLFALVESALRCQTLVAARHRHDEPATQWHKAKAS
ncbi:MAG: response regulator [Blastocatellia bacterium]